MEVEYKNIDPKLIVNEIRNGRSIEAVQKLFGLRFKSEVQDLYMKGLMELGEIPPLDFSPRRNEVSRSKNTYPESTYRSTYTVDREETLPQHQPLQQNHAYLGKEKESGRPSVIVRRKEHNKAPLVVKTENFRTIGQSGSITLNKALLIDQLGFSVGDTFEIYREEDKIILQKTDRSVI